MASSQPLERTSSRTPVFFLGIASKGPCGNVAAAVAVGEQGNRLEVTPSLDLVLVKVAVSVRRGV